MPHLNHAHDIRRVLLKTAARLRWRERTGHASGFTAIELMATLAVLAILATVAIPAFGSLADRWRVRQGAEGLHATLSYARSEAIKRGGQVVIQKLPNNTGSCTTAANNTRWDCGWLVCHDLDDSGQCDASEPILQRFQAPARLKIERAGGGATIKLNRWGLVAGTWPSFGFQAHDRSAPDTLEQHLCMGSGGRIRVVAGNSC